MFSISRKTADWVKKGLISAAQAQDIIAFEQNRKSYFSLFSVLLFLGAFSIACGVVAVVSSNWYAIPGAVKITGMFLFLTVAAFVLARIKDKHPTGFEAGLFFYMMSLFAAIGLVGQVYHLKSDTYVAFLFWSILAFPLLLLTRKVFLGWIWEYIFIASLSASPWGRDFWKFFFRSLGSSHICISFLALVLFFVLLRVKKASVFVVPLRSFVSLVAVFALFMHRHDSFTFMSNTMDPFVWAPLLFFLIAAGFSFFVWKNSVFGRSEKQALSVVVGLYLLYFLSPPLGPLEYFFQLGILIGLIFTAYRFGSEKTVRLLVGVTAFRMLTAFFTLFGSLLATGIGMIVSGAVVLGMAYACFRMNACLKLKLIGKGKSDE